MDPVRMRNYRVQDRGRPEDLWQPLYDRVNYAAAGANLATFFSTPRGGTATLIRAGVTSSVQKTTRDTNLDTAGQMPSRGFQARGISVAFIPASQDSAAATTDDVAEDINYIRYGGYLIWKVGDKTILELPIHLIPAYTILEGFAATTLNSASICNAQPSNPRGMYVLGVPITFQPFDTFTVTMNWDGTVAVSQTFDIQLIFHGITRRPT